MANRLRASWGIQKDNLVPSGVSGVVTDYDETLEPVFAALQDEVGADIGHTVYDIKKSASITIQCKASSTIPSPDQIITIGGVQFYVERAQITQSNQSYMKFSASVSRSVKSGNAPAVDTAP